MLRASAGCKNITPNLGLPRRDMATALRLVPGRYPGATFQDLISATIEHNVMMGKSHKVLRRSKHRIALVCSAGRNACDFHASATPLKRGSTKNLGGVEGIRITKFVHHSCTVGCQRSRQITSKVLANVVSALHDYVPEKGPGGAAKQMQDTVKQSSGIDIGIGQAHQLIKMRRDEIKNATGRAPLTQQERIDAANNQLLENLCKELGSKNADGTYAVISNTGKRKKAALAAAEVFFRLACDDLVTYVAPPDEPTILPRPVPVATVGNAMPVNDDIPVNNAAVAAPINAPSINAPPINTVPITAGAMNGGPGNTVAGASVAVGNMAGVMTVVHNNIANNNTTPGNVASNSIAGLGPAVITNMTSNSVATGGVAMGDAPGNGEMPMLGNSSVMGRTL